MPAQTSTRGFGTRNEVLYQLQINNTGDAVEDLVRQFTFTGNAKNQRVSMQGPAAPVRTGTMSVLINGKKDLGGPTAPWILSGVETNSVRGEQRRTIAKPDSTQPKHQLQHDVQRRIAPRPLACEKHRLEPEGRKGGEATQQSREQQQASTGGEDVPSLGDPGEEPDGEAPGDVHREGSKGKSAASSGLSDEATKPVPSHGAEKPAAPDEQELTHRSALPEHPRVERCHRPGGSRTACNAAHPHHDQRPRSRRTAVGRGRGCG